jgi:hypothetical protein
MNRKTTSVRVATGSKGVDMSSWSGTMISRWTPRLSVREASVIAVLASVGLMWAAPAAADPPTRTEFTVPLSGPHFLSGFCGTQIEQDGGAHIASTGYGDGRLIEQVRVDLVLTANGNIAYEEATFTVVVDPSAGTVTQTGTLVNIHAGGAGLLVQEVGRVVLDPATFERLSLSGRWMIMQGELEQVCSYFATGP